MEQELRTFIEKMNNEWTNFKSENDRRIKEIEVKGKSDPLTEDKINRHSQAIGEMQKSIDQLTAKLNRPGVSPVDEATQNRNDYAKSYGKFLRKGEEHVGGAASLREMETKAFSLAVNADGGFTVPQDMDKNLYEVQLKRSPIRQYATVIQVGNEKYERMVNIHGMAGGWVAETAARPATNSAQFAQFKPVFGEMYAHSIASQRVLDDSMFNLENHIETEAGKTFGILENIEFTSGAGVAGTSPKGILAYTPSLTPVFGTNILMKKSGSSGVITADTLIDVPHSLLAAYRGNAMWSMQSLTVAAVRKLKDTTNQYLWQPGLNGPASASLLGFPIFENEDMPAVAASANAILFGDFQAYIIADVVGTRILRDPYTNKPNVVFYITKRVGGGLIDTNAIIAYQLTP